MIENYKKPQLIVRQKLDRNTPSTADRLNLVLIGPDYLSEQFGRDDIMEYANYAGTTEYIQRHNALGNLEPLTGEYEIKDDSDVVITAAGAEASITKTGEALGASWTNGDSRQVVVFGSNVIGDSYDTANLADQMQVGDTLICELSTGQQQEVSVVSMITPNRAKVDRAFAMASAFDTDFTYTVTVKRRGNFVLDSSSYTLDKEAFSIAFKEVSLIKFKLGDSIVDAKSIGRACVSFRALRKPDANEAPQLASEAGIISLNMDSELGYAVHCALAGGGGENPVYIMRTAGDTVNDFQVACEQLKYSDIYYFLVPITANDDVMLFIRDHVAAMSAQDVKNFRRAYCGRDPFEAQENSASISFSKDDTKLTLSNVDTALGADEFICVGDRVKIGTEEYTVVSRAGSTRPDETIWVDTAPGGTETVLSYIKYPTAQRVSDDMAAFAESLDSRRVALVFTSNGDCSAEPGTVQPNRFLAAEIGGLRASMPPQQGLTRQSVNTIRSSAGMYTAYTEPMQNAMASHGVMLVTQEKPGGDVRIRHQLTTETDDGSLAYEDSIGVNFDQITFGLKDIADQYIGKYNGNDTVLQAIEDQATGYLVSKTKADDEYRELGPQLVAFRNLRVTLHPQMKDQFLVGAELDFALPLNRGIVTLQASVATNL